MNPSSILIVEDDFKLGHLLEEYLQSQGFSVSLERQGDLAVPKIIKQEPDLVILDLMLPGMDGLQVCREVRSLYHGQILMLTARKTDIDQIVGLELGADDYVAKPVEPRLLLARIRTLLRRFQKGQTEPLEETKQRVTIGTFTIDPIKREAFIEDNEVDLTAAEYDVLWFLISRRGEVVTRQDLYLELRGIPYNGFDRGMDIHISRIRRKIRSCGGEMGYLKSIRGTGYLVVGES